MKIISEIDSLREFRRGLRGTTGFVPTMGGFHAGHEALIKRSVDLCDHTLVSIFVNPIQFDDHGDFVRYPRDHDRDLAIADQLGVAAAFCPTSESMFPTGAATTTVTVENISDRFEGSSRRGHFTGVATIVGKLFNLVVPDIAFFGRKDAQQVAVVKQLVRDLNWPVEVEVVDTVRERDGLAMSTRNVLLSSSDREKARALPQAIRAAVESYERAGADPVSVAAEILASSELQVDYLELVDAATFIPTSPDVPGQKLLIAACHVGNVRLIDNAPIAARRDPP